MSQEKQIAAERAVDFIQDGMLVGLGTGSTAFFAVRRLGERIRQEGLKVRAIPTSEQTRLQAESEGIPLIDFSQATRLDLTIDGADEINGELEMIKGGGGALLREKIVARASDEVITITDSSKVVATLGQFPLPVEVTVFGWQVTAKALAALDCEPVLRQKDGKIFVTDNHQYILDCHFKKIVAPSALEREINALPGVVVCGLFVGLATRLLVGRGQTVETIERKRT